MKDVPNEITTFDLWTRVPIGAKWDLHRSVAHVRVLLHKKSASGSLVAAKWTILEVPRGAWTGLQLSPFWHFVASLAAMSDLGPISSHQKLIF